MCESKQNEFLREYGKISERLYKIAVLVTGDRQCAVRAVENAAAAACADEGTAAFADKLCRGLWHACLNSEAVYGADYRKALCEGRGLDADCECPTLIDAMSRCEKDERMLLALTVLADKTPAQIASLLAVPQQQVEQAIGKVYRLAHLNRVA